MRKARKRKPSWKRTCLESACFVLGMLTIRVVALQAFTITSGSMEPTLLVGDYVFANLAAMGSRIPFTALRIPGYAEPRRGDILVFDPPHDDTLILVKRLIGMPGDTLEMRDKVLYRNGEAQDEPYVQYTGVEDFHSASMLWQRDILLAGSRNYLPTRDTWGRSWFPPVATSCWAITETIAWTRAHGALWSDGASRAGSFFGTSATTGTPTSPFRSSVRFVGTGSEHGPARPGILARRQGLSVIQIAFGAMIRRLRNGEARCPSAFAACVLFVVSCSGAEQGRDTSLVPYAESIMPLSDDIGVLLADENTVCTTESYEYRVYCTDVNGSEVGYFGRQGEGPGEFSDHLPDLLRGPDGTIGVVDSHLNRMSVLDMTSGAFVSQVRLPGVYFHAVLLHSR